jgi:CBS domain containing-hemolysin-like protein
MGDEEEAPLVVHVRDTLLEAEERPVKEIARPAFVLESGTLVHEGLRRMRQSSEQLAVIMDGSKFIGIMTINDALDNILPAAEGRQQ